LKIKTISVIMLALAIIVAPTHALAQVHIPIVETVTEETNACVDLAGFSTPLAQRVFTPFIFNGRPLAGPQCRMENTSGYVDGVSLAAGDKQMILRPDGLLLTTELDATKLTYPLNADVDLQELASTPMPAGVTKFNLVGVWLLDASQLEPASGVLQGPDTPVDWKVWRETQMLNEINEIIKERYDAGLPVLLSVGLDFRYATPSIAAPHHTLAEVCPYMTRYQFYLVNTLYVFPVIEQIGGIPTFEMWAFVVDADPEIAQQCPNAPAYNFIKRDVLLKAIPASLKEEAGQRAMTNTRLWRAGLLYEPIGGGAPAQVDTNVSVIVVGSLLIVGGIFVLHEERNLMLMLATP
jgi:hypothetical protein